MNRFHDFVSEKDLPRRRGACVEDLQMPGVSVCASHLVTAVVDAQIIKPRFIAAHYELTEADYAWLEGRHYRFCGWVRQHLYLPPRDGHPVVLHLYGPCYEIIEDAGDLSYRWAPLPEGFDTEYGLYYELEEEIVHLLGHLTLEECVRRTLVPPQVIEIIWDCVDGWHRDAMRIAHACPRYIAVTPVMLSSKTGAREKALHVVAGEPESGRVWTLAVLDRALADENLASILAEVLSELPDPHAVQRIVTARDRATRAIVREALALAEHCCAGLDVKMMIGWLRRPAWDEALWLTTAADRLRRSLQRMARETALTVEDLERLAFVRQGYRDALHWPLAPTRLGNGWSPSPFCEEAAE